MATDHSTDNIPSAEEFARGIDGFEPCFPPEEAAELERIRMERDADMELRRRLMLTALTKSSDELLTSARANLEAATTLWESLCDLKRWLESEHNLAEKASIRLMWAVARAAVEQEADAKA